MRFELPAGVATVIGNLPFARAADASAFVLDRLPRLPSAPPVSLDGTHLDAGAVDADTREGLRAFLTGLSGRVDPIVMSLTGPVTVRLSLRSQGWDDDSAAARAVQAVEEVAEWLLALSAQLLPDAPVLLFLDEPGLDRSMHPTFPLRPSLVERMVSTVVADLDGSATVGVSVPGRADWSMLLRTGVGALAAPVTAQLDTAATEIARFLDAGGVMAWGAVPLDEPLGMSAERLWRRLSAMWCELTRLGVDPVLLRERSIITPAGGLGAFGLPQAEQVIQLATDLAGRVWAQTVGVRLSIGA